MSATADSVRRRSASQSSRRLAREGSKGAAMTFSNSIEGSISGRTAERSPQLRASFSPEIEAGARHAPRAHRSHDDLARRLGPPSSSSRQRKEDRRQPIGVSAKRSKRPQPVVISTASPNSRDSAISTYVDLRDECPCEERLNPRQESKVTPRRSCF